jgi:hypothetical protein
MTKNLVSFAKREGWKWLITGMTIAGLAIAGRGYLSVRADTEALEFSGALTDRLVEMDGLGEAIGQIAAGQSDNAKKLLEARLSSVTAQVRGQLDRVDSATRAFAVLACLRSAQSEQANPSTYLSSSGSIGSEAPPQPAKITENN